MAKIFIVEDDIDVRDSLIMLLEFEGFKVEFAEDGAEALDKLNAMDELPGIIILDWMMPKMDGAQFYEQKKTIPRLNNIPIVLLTADGRVKEKSVQIAAAAGLAKPIELDVLLSAIHRHIA